VAQRECAVARAEPALVLHEQNCPRRIFAERFECLLARFARRTNEATELLVEFGLRAGGEGGHGWHEKPACRQAQTRCCDWSRCWA